MSDAAGSSASCSADVVLEAVRAATRAHAHCYGALATAAVLQELRAALAPPPIPEVASEADYEPTS